jgi:hypothetical protein
MRSIMRESRRGMRDTLEPKDNVARIREKEKGEAGPSESKVVRSNALLEEFEFMPRI